MAALSLAFLICVQLTSALGGTLQSQMGARYFDVQGHRGGRGFTVENTLPSFAWGLISGVTTLELDNGISKDGAVIVWHDEDIVAEKCQDTTPAFPNDPDFPYVGKFIANLTLAQIKTLDCGSQRLTDFPLQLTYPGTKLSTLQEVFDFVACADPKHEVQWNIESKLDAEFPQRTRTVDDFVERQHTVFASSPYRRKITFQSFDWRSLVAMKKLDPNVITSALISSATLGNGTTPWLAGITLDDVPGSSIGAKIAKAAKSIDADILSAAAESSSTLTPEPTQTGYVPFTTKDMINTAHELGIAVKPWTVNRLNTAEQLVNWGVDGIISDYPDIMRRWIQQRGYSVAPKYAKKTVLKCLEEHIQVV